MTKKLIEWAVAASSMRLSIEADSKSEGRKRGIRIYDT